MFVSGQYMFHIAHIQRGDATWVILKVFGAKVYNIVGGAIHVSIDLAKAAAKLLQEWGAASDTWQERAVRFRRKSE